MALLSTYQPLQSAVCSNPLGVLSALVLCYALSWLIYTRSFHPLAGIPGPFWASVTGFWYVRMVRQGNCDVKCRKLHDEYGYLVRIAPDEVSFADPAAVRFIYGIKTGFTKTDFYLPFRSNAFDNSHPDYFTNQDEATHTATRKHVNQTFSMSSVLEGEKYIDSCTELFLERLAEYEKSGATLDMGMWLQWYSFDNVGELFFGAKLGFMENRRDMNGYIKSLDTLMPIISTAGVMAKSLRGLYFLSGLLFPTIRSAISSFGNIEKAAIETVEKRQELISKGEHGNGRKDLLAKLFAVHLQKGSEYTPSDITRDAHGAFFAGSDTTSIALTSILYHIIAHQPAYQKLMHEIEQAVADGRVSMPITYAQAIKLPYFSACCKEGLRLHPSVGMNLPRHVPKGGCTISGQFLPGGSKVGINAAVLHYDKSIFGEDAAEFRPERWLESNAAEMERHMLHFGAGSRTCIGKNVSLAEIYKLIPSLLYEYNIELAYPDRPLRSSGWFFNKQKGFHVRLKMRAK